MSTDTLASSSELARHETRGGNTPALIVGSIGVVYGDIGTSPLYAFREAITAANEMPGGVSHSAILGVLSMIIWALLFVEVRSI